MPHLSIAIATVGRPAKLERTLSAIAALAPETPPFEVVVVVDGDDPDSHAVLARERPFPVRAFTQARGGPGAARNRAAEEARGDLLLFLNDDTRPDPACLLAHLRAQERHGPCMTAGLVAWDPEREITPYMAWLAPAGHQFNFARLVAHAGMPWDAVWGAQICAPLAWVKDEPFDPGLPFTCLEDSEWAYRQYRRGRRAIYVPEAVALHDHRYTGPTDYRSRARSYGAAAPPRRQENIRASHGVSS